MDDVTYFPTSADLRAWFEAHHADSEVLWVGYYKKATGIASITWPESVDQALCFGWIDGVRYKIDDQRYKIRFTPRRARSTWSNVNIQRVEELIAAGLMRPAGLAGYEARGEERSGVYTYEQPVHELEETYRQQIQANPDAWAFFEAQAAWYRRTALRWILSAKKEETRQRRLATLIADSAAGRTVPPLTRNPK